MKKRKSLIISAIIAVLVIAAGIGVTAAGVNSFIPTLKFENNIFAKRTRTIEFAPDNTYSERKLNSGIPEGKIKLKYKETTELTGVGKTDVYYDEQENQYEYDSSGVFKCYNLNNLDRNLNSYNAKAELTEIEARGLAFKYAQRLFGERVDGYEYEWSSEQEKTKEYTFGFVKRYGYAIGPYCFVSVGTDGLLLSCHIVNEDKFDDFDLSKLDKMPKEKFLEYVDEQVKLQYKDTMKEYEVHSIFLELVNDKYYLTASVIISLDDDIKCMEEYKYLLD